MATGFPRRIQLTEPNLDLRSPRPGAAVHLAQGLDNLLMPKRLVRTG